MRNSQSRRRAAAAAAILVLSAGVGVLWAVGVPAALGVDEAQAKQTLETALRSGFVSVYSVRNVLKSATTAQRAQIVEQSLQWAKAYTESPEFAADYAKARTEAKPQPLEAKPSIDEELKKQRAEQQKQIEESKKAAASMPADQRKAFDEAIAQMIASVEQMNKDPQIQEMQRKGIEMQRQQEQKDYEDSLERWKETYPEDPKVLIAKRLKAFLDTCMDVDFNAQLVESNNKMRFAEPSYEKKPAEWKLCYRAGREPVFLARTFASAWLAQLK